MKKQSSFCPLKIVVCIFLKKTKSLRMHLVYIMQALAKHGNRMVIVHNERGWYLEIMRIICALY